MAKTEEKKPLLTMEGKEYFRKDLSNEEIKMVAHLENVENKMRSNIFVQDQLQVTKDAFINMLKESINKEEEQEDELE
jgi:hypothetical protein|tara:strand:- start:1493 stop:1726 length:234 start_codon:yes stop_codon:yes gene_type:complete